MDAIESQWREQTNEAKKYARHKRFESDKQLRAELDKTIPGMIAALEGKMAQRINIVENALKPDTLTAL